MELHRRSVRPRAQPQYPRLLETHGRDELALVHLLQLDARPGSVVETVDAVDPRFARGEKAVIILSTQLGCPVGCAMCDAAGPCFGNPSAEQLLAQVRFVLERRPEILESRKLKVHFARMGEPALNAAAVLEALERLPELAPAAGLLPCVATVAPAGSEEFLRGLLDVKRRRYQGRFQLQLSINTTDDDLRRRLIPIPTLARRELAALAAPFHGEGDRRVVLNFALARGVAVDPAALRRRFAPAHFMIKLTPVNPTARAVAAGLESVLSAASPRAADALVAALEAEGYETVVSIGEPAEIAIGSNCGQLVRARQTSS
jgi:23S rRNA (adenine2503-C2)-methyltransferase